MKSLKYAELLDAWRVVPRMLILGYIYLIYVVVNWFMLLPDPSNSQAALVSTVCAAAAAVFGLYSNSGRSWPAQSKKEE